MPPTIVITMEITEAKIGRSIKKRENTGKARNNGGTSQQARHRTHSATSRELSSLLYCGLLDCGSLLPLLRRQPCCQAMFTRAGLIPRLFSTAGCGEQSGSGLPQSKMRTGVGMSKHTNPGTSGRPKVRSNFGANFSLYCADSSCFRQLAACLRADVNGRFGQ